MRDVVYHESIRSLSHKVYSKNQNYLRFFSSLQVLGIPLNRTGLLSNPKARPPLIPLRIANNTMLISISNLRLTEPVQLPPAQRVQVNRVSKRDTKPSKRHRHTDMIPSLIRQQPRQTGEQRTAADGCHDPGATALGVPPQPADGQREDGGEDARLEEQDNGQHGNTGLAVQAHRQRDEEYDSSHERQEDEARLNDHHRARGREPSDCKKALADGVPVTRGGVGQTGGLDAIVYKVCRHANLRANVAELRGDAEHELVLLAHGLVLVTGQVGAHLGLELHVRVGDLGNWGEVEDDGQEGDEGRDAEVGPLHFGQVVRVDVVEEDARGEEGRHDATDGLERLAQLKAKLGQARRPAGGDERVSGDLEGGEARADDEEGAAEAAEGAVDGAGPEHEGADGVDQEAEDEGPAVAEAADDPAAVCRWSNEVRPKVRALQTTCFGGGDIEGGLKFRVKDVEKAVL